MIKVIGFIFEWIGIILMVIGAMVVGALILAYANGDIASKYIDDNKSEINIKLRLK